MEIRGATIDDSRAIAEIHVAGWRGAYRGLIPDTYLAGLSVEKRQATWRTALETGEPHILLATESGGVMGWIAFGKCRDSDQAPDTGEIWALYAHPDHWSRGVGRSLWLTAREKLAASGFRRITLWVLAANERACRFYRKAGFTEDPPSRTERDFGGVKLDEIRLISNVEGLA